jgi:hypothetical protein
MLNAAQRVVGTISERFGTFRSILVSLFSPKTKPSQFLAQKRLKIRKSVPKRYTFGTLSKPDVFEI